VNSAPKGSVMVAIRPYRKSSGAPAVPPPALARSTTASVSATSKMVAQAERGRPGGPSPFLEREQE
jgi:hypothetical protein